MVASSVRSSVRSFDLDLGDVGSDVGDVALMTERGEFRASLANNESKREMHCVEDLTKAFMNFCRRSKVGIERGIGLWIETREKSQSPTLPEEVISDIKDFAGELKRSCTLRRCRRRR